MRLVSFRHAGRESFGAVKAGGVVELAARTGAPDLRSLIAAGGLAGAAELVAGTAPDLALDAIAYLPPIPAPEKIICVGVNYAQRNTEYDNLDVPKYPSIFMRWPGSLVGHNEPLLRPPESAQLDYEGECAIVIGRGGRRIAAADAPAHIAGLTCLNEGTVRDWLRHGQFNVTQGKNFAATGAIGPWLVTSDEFPGYDALRVTTRVNGQVRQDDTTKNLIFGFAELLRYISIWAELKPGDVIATGTPLGAGVRMKPPRYLVAGDRVEVEVSGVGVLSNPVKDEA